MSALASAVKKHRARIVGEVQQALSRSQIAFDIPSDTELAGLLAELLDALVARVRIADEPRLHEVLRRSLRLAGLKPALVVAAVVRLGAAVRKAIFAEMDSRRMASMASSGLDRVIAEGLEEIRNDFSLAGDATFVGAAVPDAVRDPTIIRNIKEILGTNVAERLLATVIVIAVRELPEGAGGQARLAREALRSRLEQALASGGAKLLLEHPSFVGGYIRAGVAGSDVTEALTISLGLLRTAARADIAIGVARGQLSIESGKLVAHGAGLTAALALAAAAPRGELRCDEGVYETAGSTYVMQSAPPPVPSYRLDVDQPQWLDRWEHAALVGEPELIGRDAELARIAAELSASDTPVRVIALRGRAGAGKYRLLASALAAAGIPADRLLYGRPHPIARAPYWPLVSIARQILQVEEGPLGAALIAERIGDLGRGGAHHAALEGTLPTLHALFGVEPAEDTAPNAINELEPAALRTEIAKSLRTLLRPLAERDGAHPVVLILPDMQEIDVPSAHALAQLVRSWNGPGRLVLAMTCRGTFRPPVALTSVPYSEISVERLDDEQILELARSMLDQPDLPPGLSELLLKRADGSPLVASTLLRYLVESGLLQRHGGGWEESGTPRPTELPRRLTELLARRIEQLPANLAAMLKTAAAIGEQLPWRIVEPVWVGRGIADHDELMRASSLLEQIGFLRRRRDGSLVFAHTMVREVAYRLLSDEERRQAHRLVAEAFREAYPDAVAQMPMLLFHHRMKAGDRLGAREAGVRAARRSALLHDHKQGIAAATQALATCEEESSEAQLARYELLCARELIHDARGNRREQSRDVKSLLELTEQLAERGRRGTVLHRAARLHLMTGNIAKAKEMGEQALEILEHGEPLDLSNALRTMALVRWRARDSNGAASALTAALGIYERLGHRRGMGFVLHNLGLFALDTGAIEQARGWFQKALALKEETDDQHGQAVVLDALGQAALLAGQPAEAATFLERALGLRRSAGDLGAAVPTQISLGEALLASDPLRAEQLAREAQKASRGKRLARAKVEAHLLVARALLRQGKHKAAARPAGIAVERAAELDGGLLLVRAQLVAAEVDLSFQTEQRAEHAAVQAEAAAGSALGLGAMRWRIEALSLAAAAYAHLDAEEAARLARECMAMLRGRSYPGLDQERVRARCEVAFKQAERRLT